MALAKDELLRKLRDSARRSKAVSDAVIRLEGARRGGEDLAPEPSPSMAPLPPPSK